MPEQVPVTDARALLDYLSERMRQRHLYVAEPFDQYRPGKLNDACRAAYVHLLYVVWQGQAPFAMEPSPYAFQTMMEEAEEFLSIFSDPEKKRYRIRMESEIIPVENCVLLLDKMKSLREQGRVFRERPSSPTSSTTLSDIALAVLLYLLKFVWRGQDPYSSRPSQKSINDMISGAEDFLSIYVEWPRES